MKNPKSELKTCSRCKVTKQRTEFFKRAGYCKPCLAQYVKEVRKPRIVISELSGKRLNREISSQKSLYDPSLNARGELNLQYKTLLGYEN